MSKKYKPKRDWKFGIVILACLVILWGLMLIRPKVYLFCIALMTSAFFTWIWFGTVYRVDKEFLSYRSGPLRGMIPIKKIREINPHVCAWCGVRPALSFEYLRIRYNMYDEVFIAPKDEEIFIEDMKDINPEIIITECGGK